MEPEEASAAIQRVVVFGAGSAGLIASIGLKRKIPQLEVRSGTQSGVGRDRRRRNHDAQCTGPHVQASGNRLSAYFRRGGPTWKLGIHFLWGPRPYFNYGFSRQLDAQLQPAKPHGYYCDDDFTSVEPRQRLMDLCRAFLRQHGGR